MALSRPDTSTRVVERIGVGAWRLVLSPRTTLAMLLLLLAAALLGAFVPQASGGSEGGISPYGAWPDGARPRLSAAAGALGSLGLGSIPSSPSFRFLVALVSAVSLLRMLHLWVPSWVSPAPRRAGRCSLSLPCRGQEAWSMAGRALAAAGLQVVRCTGSRGARCAVARRSGLRALVPGLFYLGLLLLVLASAVRDRWGWVGSPVELALGETQTLDPSTDLAVRLDQTAFVPRDDGTMERFESLLSLIAGGQALTPSPGQADGRVVVGLGLPWRGNQGRPAAHRGLGIYQIGFGPAARVSAQLAEGRALQLKSMMGDPSPRREVRLRFSGQQQEQLLAILDVDLVVRLLHYPSLPAQGIDGRALHVQVHRGSDGHLLAEEFLAESGQVVADEVTLRVAFEHYAILRAEREPELPLVAAGGVLVVAGLSGFLLWPPREVWLSLRPEEKDSACELVVDRADAQAPWFLRLRAQLAQMGDG